MRNERITRIKEAVVGTTAVATILMASGCFKSTGGVLESTATHETHTLVLPTIEPASTLTPTDTQLAPRGSQPISGGVEKNGDTVRQPVQEATAIPSATLTPEQAQESLVIKPDVIYTGEFVYNNFVKIEGETIALVNVVKQTLIQEINAIDVDAPKDKILRQNSTLSSLINPMGSGISADPLTEPGLSQTASDIDSGEMINTLMAGKDTTLASEILHLNTNGVLTMEIYANANDRDAALAWLATGLALQKVNIQDGKISDVWNNPSYQQTILWWRNQMLSQIQKTDLGVPEAEAERRANPDANANDMSVRLPVPLQGSVSWISCDRYRTPAELRIDQMQSSRDVLHDEQLVEDFTRANSENEIDLYVLAINPQTGFWDLDAFTLRSYSGTLVDQKESTAGEEMINCTPHQRGTLVPATITPVNFSVAIPGQPTQPGNTPGNEMTPTPNFPTSTPEFTVTQAQTQPAQPTRTPGGDGATPIVATPMPTAKPTEQIIPTQPALVPSATASF